MNIDILTKRIEALHDAPDEVLLHRLREDIAQFIHDHLTRLQHKLGLWEKRHLFDAIYALHTNIERHEAGKGMLHLCLFCLSYLDVPASERDEGAGVDTIIDMLTHQELLDQLAAVNEALARRSER